jgi:hypothetical protein
MTPKDAVKATGAHEDDVTMDGSSRFDTYVNQEAHGTLVRIENNMSTVIDLTGVDDVVEESVSRLTFHESRHSTENFRSAVRALDRTSSHNIPCIVKRFAPSSAGNKDSFIVEVSLEIFVERGFPAHAGLKPLIVKQFRPCVRWTWTCRTPLAVIAVPTSIRQVKYCTSTGTLSFISVADSNLTGNE